MLTVMVGVAVGKFVVVLTHTPRVFVEALMSFFPSSHLVCGLHNVDLWESLSWYEPALQFKHVRFAIFESGLIFVPVPQVGCLVHDFRRWFEES